MFDVSCHVLIYSANNWWCNVIYATLSYVNKKIKVTLLNREYIHY